MTRLVKGGLWESMGEDAEVTIHCSLSTSCKPMLASFRKHRGLAHQDSNDWVMIWIIDVV